MSFIPSGKERAMKKTDRAIAESERAVESQPISLRAIDVRSKTGGAQSRGSVGAREERCRSGFLDRDVETKNRRILLPEDSEHHTRSVYDRDRDARVAAERLPDRRARDV